MRMQPVTIRWSADELAAIDAARGEATRSEWVREAARLALCSLPQGDHVRVSDVALGERALRR